MNADRWKKIDDLIDSALELPEDEREDFVRQRAVDDPALCDEVLRLLHAQKDGDNFLLGSAMKIAAKELAKQNKLAAHSYLDKKIATYEVKKLLGAGGMGEVYLAFDEKLKRKVALKVLPLEFTTNDERVKRFELEARAISSLNHPNIVTIYDVGNFEGVNYIATEYVEGHTLRDLMGGKFKIRNIVANCIQICDALSAAHKEGIIHRDIKPENIMIRSDGYAKVMDFGLAKLTEIGPETQREFAKTSEGVIIGTPAYMSPAQVSDDKIDHRTDLWSCGVVLYEFLTGKNPFKGANRQETFQAILSREPALCSSLNPAIPPELDQILAKLMQKDPAYGYQSASDLRADLKRVQRDLDSLTTRSGSGSGFHQIPRSVWVKSLSTAFAVFIVALTAVTIWSTFFRTRPVGAVNEWADATRTQLTDMAGREFYPSLSPDGKSYAYAAKVNGDWDILLRRVGGKNTQNLTSDSAGNDLQPAFSPDGDTIAFRSDREDGRGIYLMGATGENPRRIADFGYHPSWSPDGKLVAVSTLRRDYPDTRTSTPSEIWTIDVASGERKLITNADARQPVFSPDGTLMAYWFMPAASGRSDIAVIPSSGGEPVMICQDGTTNWNPVWSPDGKYLYFASDRAGSMGFWRTPLDGEGRPTSGPEAVVTPAKYSSHLTFSRDGKRMLFVASDNKANIRGLKVDPTTLRPIGEPFWITTGDRQISRPHLSPDGSRFVFRYPRLTQDDIATVDVNGENLRDVTDDPAFDRYPRWSPDGKQIAFTSDRGGTYEIHIANSDGTGVRRVTSDSGPGGASFPLWSPDGNRLVYNEQTHILEIDLTQPQAGPAAAMPPYHDPKVRFVAWDWSADGDKLAATFSGDPMTAGYYSFGERRYELLTSTSYFPAWLSDSRRMLFAFKGAISVIDSQTKKITEIVKIPEAQLTGLGISRDSTLVYWVMEEEESDIWMLETTGEK
jgi:serine/threonine protein kinase